MHFSRFFVPLLVLISLCPLALADEPKSNKTLLADSRVRETIRALNNAIEREDIGAYMLRVDPSQPTFMTEQRAWITDAIKEDVQGLHYTFFGGMGDGASQRSEDEIWAPIGIRWTLEDREERQGDGRAWKMTYVARFVPLGTPDGSWVFAGPAWHFDLYDEQTNVRVLGTEDHEENTKLALERAPSILTLVEENLGKELSSDLVIKVYKKMKSLQASISPAYTDPLSGWNEPSESIKILGRKRVSKESLDPLLAHEIGHAVSFEFGPQIIDAPWWTLEGIAEVSAGLFRDSWDSKNRRIVNLAKKDNLREWEQLADFKGEAMDHAMHVYLQGWSMIDYIDRIHGIQKRNEWFTVLGAGDTLDEASMRTLGMSFDELDEQWYESLLEYQPESD